MIKKVLLILFLLINILRGYSMDNSYIPQWLDFNYKINDVIEINKEFTLKISFKALISDLEDISVKMIFPPTVKTIEDSKFKIKHLENGDVRDFELKFKVLKKSKFKPIIFIIKAKFPKNGVIEYLKKNVKAEYLEQSISEANSFSEFVNINYPIYFYVDEFQSCNFLNRDIFDLVDIAGKKYFVYKYDSYNLNRVNSEIQKYEKFRSIKDPILLKALKKKGFNFIKKDLEYCKHLYIMSYENIMAKKYGEAKVLIEKMENAISQFNIELPEEFIISYKNLKMINSFYNNEKYEDVYDDISALYNSSKLISYLTYNLAVFKNSKKLFVKALKENPGLLICKDKK